MVVLFTISSNCEICPVVEQTYLRIAASYREQYVPSETEKPVFFAVIHYQQSTNEVFRRVSKEDMIFS